MNHLQTIQTVRQKPMSLKGHHNSNLMGMNMDFNVVNAICLSDKLLHTWNHKTRLR